MSGELYMKKLIWQIRYALRIRKLSKASWSFCFEAATIATDDAYGDWRDDDPKDAADDEVSYWRD